MNITALGYSRKKVIFQRPYLRISYSNSADARIQNGGVSLKDP
jgi:hypothetical protein